MSASIEQVHEHEVDLHFLVGRARACVVLFIISDVLSVFAILAAGGYLSTLNVLNPVQAARATIHRPSYQG